MLSGLASSAGSDVGSCRGKRGVSADCLLTGQEMRERASERDLREMTSEDSGRSESARSRRGVLARTALLGGCRASGGRLALVGAEGRGEQLGVVGAALVVEIA